MYMSPEMKAGDTYSFKTDNWSAGCVLFEVIIKTPLSSVIDLKDLNEPEVDITRIQSQIISAINNIKNEKFEILLSK